MNPLSKEALAALESLELDGPDAKDERRVRESLERAIGVALPVATLAAAGAATATTAAAATGAVTAGGMVAATSTSTLTGAVAGSGAATAASSGAVAGSTGTMTAASAGAVAGSTGTMTAASSGAVAGSTATLAAGTTAGFASTAALTSLGLGAKVVLFVAALGLGSVMTLGVKAAVTPAAPTPAPAPVMPAPTRAPPPPARPLEVAVDPVVPVEERSEEPVVAEPETAPAGEPQKLAPPRGPARAPKPALAPREPELAAPSTPPEPETPEVAPPPVIPTEKAGEAVAATEDGYSVVVEVNFPSCDAATEARAAAGARRLLRDERPEHALWLLSAYQRRCPSGRWSDEAWRVRLSSLCLLDRNTEAASLLEWVSSEYPHRRAAIVSELGTTCDPEVLQEK